MKLFLFSLTLSFFTLTNASTIFNEKLANCQNNEVKVNVQELMSPKNFVAFVTEGSNENIILKCKTSKKPKFTKNHEEILFDCNETRSGEGLMNVQIVTNNDEEKLAIISRENILGNLQVLNIIKCD